VRRRETRIHTKRERRRRDRERGERGERGESERERERERREVQNPRKGSSAPFKDFLESDDIKQTLADKRLTLRRLFSPCKHK